jgi:hypothetical protein
MNCLVGALSALDLLPLALVEVDLGPDLERGLGVTGNC